MLEVLDELEVMFRVLQAVESVPTMPVVVKGVRRVLQAPEVVPYMP